VVERQRAALTVRPRVCALRKANGHALAHDEVACERSFADAHELLDRADAPPSPLDDLA